MPGAGPPLVPASPAAGPVHTQRLISRSGSVRSGKFRTQSLFALDKEKDAASIDEIASWVTRNINKRVCDKFVLDAKKSTDPNFTRKNSVRQKQRNSRSKQLWKVGLKYEGESSKKHTERKLVKQVSFRDDIVKSADADRALAANNNANTSVSTEFASPSKTDPVLIKVTPAALPQAAVKPRVKDADGVARLLPGAIDSSTGVTFEDWNPVCKCGRPWNSHSEGARGKYREGETVWSVKTDTKTEPTDTFGEVDFVGYGQKISKFVRVDHETSLTRMNHLLQNLWGLPPPNLLISVTGGAQDFTMAPGLKEVFRRGLMKAAESTGAWIVTAGTNTGVMKHVGEAVRDHTAVHGNKDKVVVLGVTPWGVLHGKEVLVGKPGEGHWPVEYNSVLPPDTTLTSMDPNHSHFVLVDNGTECQYGTEISFRVDLETSIAQMNKKAATSESTEDDFHLESTPIVSVVLEGGPGTLETVKKAIAKDIPAVIVKGSGRAADILAYAYERSGQDRMSMFYAKPNLNLDASLRQDDVTFFSGDFWKDLKSKISKEWNTKEKLDEIAQTVAQILNKRSYVTIFQLDDRREGNEIDLAILHALLKVKNKSTVDQLKLALAWNRIDIAKERIMPAAAKWEPGQLDDIMYLVIKKNRPEFVKLLLENGVSLKEFLTVRRLLMLYNEISSKSLLYELLKKVNKDKKKFSLRHVGQVVCQLTGETFKSEFLDPKLPFRGIDPDEVLKYQPVEKTGFLGSTSDIGDCLDEEDDLPTINDPVRELFIWAVLLHRQDLAVLFWHEGKDCLGAALFAQNILRHMKKESKDAVITKQIIAQTQHFSDLSHELLTECYSSSEQKARLLLVRRLENFGNTTATQLAIQAHNKEIIGHAACQTMLNSVWMGRLSPDNNIWKLYLCALFPPFIYFVKFNEKRSTREDKEALAEESISRAVSMKSFKQDDHITAMVSVREKMEGQKRSQSCQTGCCVKLKHFYSAPVIRFFFHTIFYLAFLGFYSHTLLQPYSRTISREMYCLAGWAMTIIIEEIRQNAEHGSKKGRSLFFSYFKPSWNLLELCTILTFLASAVIVVLSALTDCPRCVRYSRPFMTMNLMAFYFRILHSFSIYKELGPKLVMIGKMMKDLIYFFIILVVFMISYGIAIQHLLYPSQPLTWDTFDLLLRRAFFQMNGEFMLEESLGQNDTCLTMNDQEVCPEKSFLPPIMLAVYVLVMNVLMLNLLIAMFSNTYSEIQQNADLVYRVQLYHLIKEFYTRLPLPPPLIVLNWLVLAVRVGIRRCCKRCLKAEDWFDIRMDENEERQFTLWESVNVEGCMREKEAEKKRTIEEQVKATNKEVLKMSSVVDQLVTRLHEMKSAQVRMAEDLEERMALKTSHHDDSKKVHVPEDLNVRMTRMETGIDKIDRILRRSETSNQDGSFEAPLAVTDLTSLSESRQSVFESDDPGTDTQRGSRLRNRVLSNLDRQERVHVKSRSAYYTANNKAVVISRTKVPDDRVDWRTAWVDYRPVIYTDKDVLQEPKYADINLLDKPSDQRPQLMYNQFDSTADVDRTSHMGQYQVIDGLPQNPRGRTGLSGRGSLGRWGPNHASDLVLTRSKIDESTSEKIVISGKPVLEFISVKRSDTGEWSIPGTFGWPNKRGVAGLKDVWMSEFESLLHGQEQPQNVQGVVDRLKEQMKNGVEVYRGYADDPRNTDNAWIETVAVNVHDEQDLLRNLTLQPGQGVEEVKWQEVSCKLVLYANHLNILKHVATHHNASF